MDTIPRIPASGSRVNREPYPHLDDATLEEVVADWTAGVFPPAGDPTLRALRLVVDRVAARMDLNRRKAA
jgi:hypothetical protein